jgi:pimeloyl-ACP methyl ester carboxylesterase
MQRRMTVLASALCAALACSAATPAAAHAAAAGHYTGTLADGATWTADIPANWNGTLILFSHGFGPTVVSQPPAASALLAQGYAITASSYDPNGSWWALASAERDQFATLAAFKQQFGVPKRTIAMGVSMGGLINSQIAEDGAGKVNAALNLCGLVAGGVDLNNYQLNAEYAITQLLPGAADIPIRDFASPGAGAAAAAQLSAAVTAAQGTAAGQARIALVGALLNEADWAPGNAPPAPRDYSGQEAQEEDWMTTGGQLTFIEFGRYYIESAAGGDSSWNAGVDYGRLIRGSAHYDQVKALYKAAGLNLDADLDALTANAHYTAEPGSLAAMQATSTNTGELAVPLLDIHTTSDQLVPVEQESAFADKVREAGKSSLLRQAYVAAQGHCTFTDAEVVAALDTVDQRMNTGHWGDSASAADLQAAATALNLDGAAFTDFRNSDLVVQNPSPRSGH